MIRAIPFSIAGTAALLIGVAASAQTSGGGVPGTANPYARPESMDEHDRMSATDVIQRGIEQADADRNAARARAGGRAMPAKPADIVATALVFDMSGQNVGKIETVDPDGAVVATAAGKVKVPLQAFGKNRNGLLIGLSKKDFEAMVAKANASPGG